MRFLSATLGYPCRPPGTRGEGRGDSRRGEGCVGAGRGGGESHHQTLGTKPGDRDDGGVDGCLRYPW